MNFVHWLCEFPCSSFDQFYPLVRKISTTIEHTICSHAKYLCCICIGVVCFTRATKQLPEEKQQEGDTGQADNDLTPSVLTTSEQSSFTAVPATVPSPLNTTEVCLRIHTALIYLCDTIALLDDISVAVPTQRTIFRCHLKIHPYPPQCPGVYNLLLSPGFPII